MSPEQQVIVNYKKLLYEARFSDWINNDIFTPRWWVLLLSLVLPWLIWYILVDKTRLREMLLYMLSASCIAILLDEIGTNLTMWSYPVAVIPVLPRLIAVNYSIVPIIFVLIYQYFPSWKSFITANIILTLIFSFVLEPILVWIKLYNLITWKHVYSIPVYIFSAVILKIFIETINLLQNKSTVYK